MPTEGDVRNLSTRLQLVGWSGDKINYLIEPVSTTLILLQAATALVNLVGLFSKEPFLKNVSGPLQRIISALDTIMREIDALKEFIPVALDDAFRKSLTISVATLIDQFQIKIASFGDEELRRLPRDTVIWRELNDIFNEQMKNTLSLRGYGYPGYFAVTTACLSTISMAAVLRQPKSMISSFSELVCTWLQSCADPQQSGSLGFAEVRMREQGDAIRAQLSSHPRNVWLGSYTARMFSGDLVGLIVGRGEGEGGPGRGGGGGFDSPRVETFSWYATLSGDYQTDFSWIEEGPIAGQNGRGWPLIPWEDADLHDRAESAHARCRNSLNGVGHRIGLNQYAAMARSLDARANEVAATVEGIKNLVPKIAAATENFGVGEKDA